MLILKEFFDDLYKIQDFEESKLAYKESRNYRFIDYPEKHVFENYYDYIIDRLDFKTKYSRILRGISLLSLEEFELLIKYYNGTVILGIDDDIDKLIAKIVHDVENAI